MQQVYDLTREDIVLRTFFSDKQLSQRMMPFLDPTLYEDKTNQKLAEIVNKFVRKYHRPPEAQEIVVGLENAETYGEVRKHIINICNANVTTLRPNMLVELLEKFYQEKAVYNLLRQSAVSIYENNVDAVRELIPQIKNKINFSLHISLGLDLIEDIDEAKRRLKEISHPIPSGITDVNVWTAQRKDDPSTGGYPRKTLCLYVGQPNVGKTLVLCSEACYAVRAGYNVMYISLELSEEYLWRRMAANLTGIDQYQVTELSTEECKQRIENARLASAEKMGCLKIKRMKTTTTPYEIEAVLDEYESVVGAPVDMLVIDYIGIMRPNQRAGMLENMYKDGQAKAEQIREICNERNIVGLSAIQFGRPGYSSLDAGLESVRESSGYNETAHLMITITLDSILKGLDMYYHVIKKNRFGENEVPFYTKRNYGTMLWYPATQEDVEEEHRRREEFDVVTSATSNMFGSSVNTGFGRTQRSRPAPPKKSHPPMTAAEQKEALGALDDMSALV
jgi:replicative DNA helicase